MNPLAAIHVARKQLGLDDADYRAVLERVAGVRSAKALTPEARLRVLEAFRGMGFAPAPPRARMPGARRADIPLDGPFAAKLQALWISGYHLGVVRDRSNRALAAFVERQTGLSHTRFLRSAPDAARAIEALKGWMAREAGIVWPGRTAPPEALKQAVLAAQYARVGEPAAPPCGTEPGDDLDDRIARLGRRIRALRGKPRR